MARRLSERELPEAALYEGLDLKSEGVTRLMAYLVEEHRQALSAHEEYFTELKMFRRMIVAKPATKIKTFPWPGASNIVVPLIRIAGDAIKARIVNTLLGPKPFWVITSPASTYANFAKPVERFMEWGAKDAGIVDTVEAITDQVVYLGKCPVKIHWWQVMKKARTYNRRTRKEAYITRTVRDQPTITPILLENWLEPWGIEDSTEKPWNSQRVFLRAGDLIEREKQGLARNSEELVNKLLGRLPPDMIEAGELRERAWAETQVIPLYETHVQFDVDKDGFREELIATWSYEFGIPIRVTYNFFFHGKRPLEMLYYLRNSDDRSSGDGIAHLLWQLQEALSTFVNQRSDNITIANTRYYKARKNSGIKKGEQIYPGKVFLLDNPESDLIADKLGDVSPSSFTHESILRDYGERLSGISDPQLGREFDNPRVAATTTLSVLQEGNRRFDMVIRILREAFGRIGTQMLQLYQQFEPRVRLGEILSPEDEVYVQQVLDMSPEEIEKNFIFQVNTSTATSNKESQRQGLLALFNLVVGFYGQVNQVATEIIANPQAPDAVKDMIIEMAGATHKILKEIVQSYDISDPDSFLIDVAEGLRAVRAGTPAATIESQMQGGLENFAAEIGAPKPGGGAGGGPGTANPPAGTEIPVGGTGLEAAQAIS